MKNNEMLEIESCLTCKNSCSASHNSGVKFVVCSISSKVVVRIEEEETNMYTEICPSFVN